MGPLPVGLLSLPWMRRREGRPPLPQHNLVCVCVEKITLLYLTYLVKRIVYSWGSRRPVSRVTV